MYRCSDGQMPGKPNVSVYLLDEPSRCVQHSYFLFSSLLVASFLDSEQRIIASKVIKRCVIWRHKSSLSRSFILHVTKIAFVIEHDFIMATYLSDRDIIFEGQPAISATVTS